MPMRLRRRFRGGGTCLAVSKRLIQGPHYLHPATQHVAGTISFGWLVSAVRDAAVDRCLFLSTVGVAIAAFDLGARGALFGRRVLGLRGVACAPPLKATSDRP